MSKKILFIHHGKGWGGAPKSLIQHIELLGKEGYQVKILLIFKSDLIDILDSKGLNYQVINNKFYKYFYKCFAHTEAEYIPIWKFWRLFEFWTLWILSAFHFSKKILIEYKDYDIFHFNSSVLLDWLFASRHFETKKVIHIREPFRNRKGSLRTVCFLHILKNYANEIIAISKDNQKRIDTPQNSIVIYNPLPNIIDSTYRRKESKDVKSKSILFTGGTSKLKGYRVFLKSLKYLDEDIQIKIIGANHLKFTSKKIEFIRPDTDIQDIIKSSTLIIVPIIRPHFTRVVLEAYLESKPVIASDVDGMDEIVLNGKTGYMFRNKDYRHLAEIINTTLKDSSKITQLGANGQRFVSSFLNTTSYLNKYSKVYS